MPERIRKWLNRFLFELKNWRIWCGLFLWGLIQDRFFGGLNKFIDRLLKEQQTDFLNQYARPIIIWAGSNPVGRGGLGFLTVAHGSISGSFAN